MKYIVDISSVKLETERLILRPFEVKDLEDFFEYASVEGVGECAGWNHHENIEVSKDILTDFIRERKTFALVYKENNKVIGSLGLEESKEDIYKLNPFASFVELGYVLGMIHKALYSWDIVFFLYLLNFVLVGADMVLYYIYKNRDEEKVIVLERDVEQSRLVTVPVRH